MSASNYGTANNASQLPNTPSKRRANHWIGSCKMGTDDGRLGGSAVVDTNTKVYGTDNLFVVDASVFPGMVTGNPSAAIVVVAEKAFERITALQFPSSVAAVPAISSAVSSATAKASTPAPVAVIMPTISMLVPAPAPPVANPHSADEA